MAGGRNAPCPCGSGRKYKHCCGLKTQMAKTRRLQVVVALVVVVVAAGVAAKTFFFGDKGQVVSQPGPAPPGKAWSEEHGHWHNEQSPLQPGTATQARRTQPEGPPPPGKVWNAEHGHWHNDLATQTPADSG